MQKEKKSDLLQKEEKKYQKPTMVSLGKLVEETKAKFATAGTDSGADSRLSGGG